MPYPSDLSDEQWALIEPVITAWKDRHRSVSGHQGAYEMREIVNALLCQGRTGCQWAYLPHDLPQKTATSTTSPPGGTTELTRSFMSFCAARSVNVWPPGSPPPRVVTIRPSGCPGRMRGLAVDVLGLVIAVVVLSANTHDNAAGIILLDQVTEHADGSVRKALVDQGFT
jgi:transposase